MPFRKDFWTYVIVTMVTVLIWTWAAAETREERTFYVRHEFIVPDPTTWVVRASDDGTAVTVEGSVRALRQMAATVSEPVALHVGANGVPGDAGTHTVDVAAVLAADQSLRGTGVSILSADPPTIGLEIDQLATARADVRVRLPGIQHDEMVVTPSTATITMPARLRGRWPDVLTVEAVADPLRLAQLEPGSRHTIQVSLRLPEALAAEPSVQVTPSEASITFTIRSRIRETTLDTVRVQLSGPPASYGEYDVQVREAIIRDVTISAESDLVRRIEAGDVTVVALLHVSNRDKENGIQLKPVTCFLALVSDEDGGTEGIPVQATVAGASERPLVHLDITPREQ